EAALQEKATPLFHYALNPDGYLFLGPAESVDGVPDYFRVVDKRNRIFQRVEALVRPLRHFPLTFVPTVTGRIADRVEPLGGARPDPDLTPLTTASLLDNHAPPAVVVSDRGDIVFVAGRTGRYLEATTGALTHNLFDLVRRPI